MNQTMKGFVNKQSLAHRANNHYFLAIYAGISATLANHIKMSNAFSRKTSLASLRQC